MRKGLNYLLTVLYVLIKLPVRAAKPATRAPISAVTIINRYGLSVLKINKETR